MIEDPSIYTVVMSMCEKIGSGEAAKAVREDMDRQGLTMNTKYVKNFKYFCILIIMHEQTYIGMISHEFCVCCTYSEV